MTLTLIIALFIIGFVLIAVELLITPGFIIGLIGLGFLGTGIYVIYTEYGNTAGNISLAAVSILLIAFFVLSLRSGFWTRIASKERITGKANAMNKLSILPGSEGTTLSALRPSGTVLFTEGKFEVQTEGAFIDAGAEVVVVKINNNKITVKPKE